MLTLYRTPIVLGSNPGARVCFIEVTDQVFSPPPTFHREDVEKLGAWPAIENADDPDKMPAGSYELVMARVPPFGNLGLQRPGTEQFGQMSNGVLHLKGGWAPASSLTALGFPAASSAAMYHLLDTLDAALGGWAAGKRVPFRCVELGELPAVRYKVVETFPLPDMFKTLHGPPKILPNSCPKVGERWTRLPNGDVLVEREVE